MYKVLIIDDEEPSREAIRILGDWAGLGVGEVLEAGNGRAGLALLRERKPDLVLVDMKMPEMDGVAFLREVERDFPNLFTIVISGYDDFEFTRQAIRSRVADYLLKPVNRQDLNQALRKAIDLVEARKSSESEVIHRNITLNMSLPKLKEDVYLSIIARTFKFRGSAALLPLIGADDPDKRFGAASVRLLNLETVAGSRFGGETGLLLYAVSNIVNEMSEEGFQSFGLSNPKAPRELIVIHAMAGGTPEDFRFRSAHFMHKVLAAVRDLFGLAAIVGLGPQAVEIGCLADAYDAAAAAVGGIDLRKLADGVVAASPPPPSGEIPSVSGRMPLLRGAIESGHASQARSVVLDWTRRLRELDSFSLDHAYRLLGELVILLNDMAIDFGVPPAKLAIGGADALASIGVGTDFTGMEEYEALLCRLVDRYAELARSEIPADRPFDVGEIKAYIDRHYFEEIKISMFTERYYLSREYLMKLFKQQFGFGIHEYVQKVRMDKARELLNDPALKIQDISEMLGYKDKNYFSKAFRNYVGLSPSEYRLRREDGEM